MQYFYDGQIRRYLLQVIRLLSNFLIKYGDGTLVKVPVVYGDADRQVANIINSNSENQVASAPMMAVYITDLELDTNRLADPSFVGKIHIRERAIDVNTGEYTSEQGNNYTVERLMPTPFKMTLKVDIWTTSTDQKLQLLEQMLQMFNPSLEIQTTDNFVDWTSLTVVDLTDVNFSSRTVPVGTNDNIDIATLGLSIPIYISPPAKVKRLGITTSIISNVLTGITENDVYVPGLGTDNNIPDIFTSASDPLFSETATIGNFDIEVSEGVIRLISNESGEYLAWTTLIQQQPDVYKAGLTKLYLRQKDGTYVVGYITINTLDDSIMIANWDPDTYPTNTEIVSTRASSGTFDAIIDPQKTKPDGVVVGSRYLIIEDIGGGLKDTFITESKIQRINTNVLHRKVNDHKIFVNGVEVGSGSYRIPDNIDTGNYVIVLDNITDIGDEVYYELYVNEDGPDAWKNLDASDFIASVNDIIEWNGTKWTVIFNAKANANSMIHMTNIFTGTQYRWNGVTWVKTFEGVYRKGEWRLEL